MIEKYIDIAWYAQVYGKKFKSNTEAIEYYLSEGELKGDFPNPLFDPTYYRTRYALDANQSSLFHYLKVGVDHHHRPSKYFDTEWYRWQNPDTQEYGCSILHYLHIGGKEYRDPCPEVDMIAFSRSYGQLGDGVVLTYLLTTGFFNEDTTKSVTKDYIDLVTRQRIFLKEIKPKLKKSIDFPSKGRNLVFVQCAKDAEFWSWFKPDLYRNWDLLLNCYAGVFPETQVAEYVCDQPGTKFTGMFKFWLEFREIFDRYDYVFFIDDDLIFNFEDISIFFQLLESNELDIAQPSLTKKSYCTWQVFYNKQKSGTRQTNGVEIMMPALSRRARHLLLPYFLYSVSGFGLDLLMAKLARVNELSVGVIDDIVVSHEKKIDQTGGSYYEFLRNKGINSKFELARLIQLFGLERSLN